MANFLELIILLECKLSTFSSNKNFHCSTITFYDAVFKQPLILDYNCVVSGSLQQHICDYVRIGPFVVCLDYVRKQLYTTVAFHFSSSLRRFSCYVTIINAFVNVIFWYVQVAHKSYVVVSWFVIVTYSVLCDNYIFPGF